MRETELSSSDVVLRLIEISKDTQICLLDSCGAGGANTGLMVAGIGSSSTSLISGSDPSKTLAILDERVTKAPASVFTISYDFGLKLNNIVSRHKRGEPAEPDIFIASFGCFLIHEYRTGRTVIEGPDEEECRRIAELINRPVSSAVLDAPAKPTNVDSDISKRDYLRKVDEIRELIRRGETYQVNLTQKFTVALADGLGPGRIFSRLRREHPAAFAAFIDRGNDTVVSISPERFFRIADLNLSEDEDGTLGRAGITASPIKGTRPRAADPATDLSLRRELLESAKDRAENTMIVDLMRNDLGRVCKFGTVSVKSLCRIEELPSLFHLVSDVEGELKAGIRFSDVLAALFPCGSITGCPKIRTMEIIDSIEPSSRGLSMGAIGYCFRAADFPFLSGVFGSGSGRALRGLCFDVSVAIRTLTIRNGTAEFNVGGGIVIDSTPMSEYVESLNKAKAIFSALGVSSAGTVDPEPTSAAMEQSL